MRVYLVIAAALSSILSCVTGARAQQDRICENSSGAAPLALNTIRPIKVPLGSAPQAKDRFIRFSLDLRKESGAIVDLVQAPSTATGQLAPVRFPFFIVFCKEQDGRWQRLSVRSTTRVSSTQEPPGSRNSALEASLPRPTQLRQWRVRGSTRVAILIDGISGRGEFELFARPRTFAPLEDIEPGKPHPDEVAKGQTKLFGFEGKKDQRVMLEVSSEAEDFDSFVTLYGPGDENSTRIGEDDDGGGLGGNARLVADIPRDGRYVMEAASRSEGGKFEAKFQVLNCSVGEPPEIKLANDMPGSFGKPEDFCQVAKEGLLQDSPYHLYKFSGLAGHRYSITMRGEGDGESKPDPALMVRVEAPVVSDGDKAQVAERDPASQHALVGENDDFFLDHLDAGSGTTDSRVVVQFMSDAVLYVQGGLGDPVGKYVIRIEDCAVLPESCRPTDIIL